MNDQTLTPSTRAIDWSKTLCYVDISEILLDRILKKPGDNKDIIQELRAERGQITADNSPCRLPLREFFRSEKLTIP